MNRTLRRMLRAQPPSGGCVLKLNLGGRSKTGAIPAAFGRLCVETDYIFSKHRFTHPAAFGRLCVETVYQLKSRAYH